MEADTGVEMYKYIIVDTVTGERDSLHTSMVTALARMDDLRDRDGHDDWDVAYYDKETRGPGRLCSYVRDHDVVVDLEYPNQRG